MLSFADQLGAPALVTGSAAPLQQVVVNLVLNARDAMRDATRDATTLGRIELVCREGAIGARRAVVLDVTDAGSGIAEDVRPHLFEPYFTTKGEERGTGLGLATVRAIVLAHGGTIEIAATGPAGTTVRVTLPCVELEARLDRAPASRHPPL
jgi:signal transduction histidine kinase